MKKFETTIQRGEVQCRYIVTAQDEKEAAERFFQICGERKLKIKEA